MFNRSKSGEPSKPRFGTLSFFRSKKGTSSEIPNAPTESTVTVQPQESPSYAFASQQKGEVDKEAEKRGRTDEAIRADAGKAKEDQEGPTTTFVPASKKVVKNEKEDQPSTTHGLSVTRIFNRFWKGEVPYDLEEVVHATTNYWVPNAIALFEILRQSGRYVRDNRFMIKHHPEYLDYAIACYYSILFYVQILRAQQAAGKLDGFERSFLNRFKDKYRYEELPVSSIFVPYFSTIVSSLPADSKYGWIVPTFANDLFQPTVRTGFNTGANVKQGAYIIQPNVPHMLMILRKAISTFRYDNVARRTDNFDDSDRYIPLKLDGAAAVSIFGNQIHVGTEGASNSILYGCGTRYPFNASLDELELAAGKWRRSSFREFRYSITTPAAGTPNADRTSRNQPLVNDKPMNSLEHFLCMEKGENVSWFDELINQAALHARFFDGVTSLSMIPTTSGKEPMILARMYDMDDGNAIADRNAILGLDDADNAGAEHITWYPNFFNSFKAGFATNREGVDREEALQMFSFATNAEFSIVTGNLRVGGNNEHFRTGRFWANQEWASEFRNEPGQGSHAKPMFENWSIMFQEDAAVVRPQGY